VDVLGRDSATEAAETETEGSEEVQAKAFGKGGEKNSSTSARVYILY